MAKRKKRASDVGDSDNGVNLRIDPPHEVAGDGATQPHESPSELPALAMAVAESGLTPDSAVLIVQQVRNQAEQLAAHLRRQQSTLDHRESELNARLAGVDHQMRSARLWLQEKQDELSTERRVLEERRTVVALREKAVENGQRDAGDDDIGRRLVLDRREAELDAAEAERHSQWQTVACNLRTRAADLQAQEEALESRCAELAAAEEAWKKAWTPAQQELSQKQAELEERSSQLAARGVELAQLDAEIAGREKRNAEKLQRGENAEGLAARCERLESRQKHLDAAESLLFQQQAELEAQRRELEADQQAMHAQHAADRNEIVDDQRRAMNELEKKRQVLERRSDDLDARRTAIKQLRSEVKDIQRETLEMRLATEELWARLCGTMAPAALTQSLAQIRSRLAEQSRMDQVEIAEQKTELESIRLRIAQQHEKVERQQHELQDWARRREEEIERQAARLVAREQQLDTQETDFDRKLVEWQKERRGYQQEIRMLLRQLRKSERMAA